MMEVNTMTTNFHPLTLPGCTPEPLMAYLKALGIFRLVAEQKDPKSRACWQDDAFVLQSSLDREALLGFFLEEYQPTPIVAPWNGGSGFYSDGSRAAKEAVDSIRAEDPNRLEEYRQAIEASQQILDYMGFVKKPSDSEKPSLLAECRNRLPDAAVSWLDAVYVLTGADSELQPLLGSGGNDGNLDFSSNFMKNLCPVLTGLELGKKPSKRVDYEERRKGWLDRALFGDSRAPLVKSAIGQFNPGGVGGPNATAGFEGDSLTNPWDYVLMMEGALFFAGAVARRLSAESRSRAVFPFTADTSAAGYGTAVDTEYTRDGSRAELWAPLWEKPATYREVSHLFGEGRAQLGRRQATTGTDFARAVVGLGIERGVSGFQRFGFLKRNGLAFIATPLGRFRVTPKPEANLLFDLDPWVDSLHRASRGRNTPEGINRVLREIDRAILEFCAHGGPRLLQEVLIAVGHAERWLSTSRQKGSVRPLSGLSPEWLRGCDNCSPEFRLAAALASIQGVGKVGSIRTNLEPIAFDRGRWQWPEDDTSVAWRGGDPVVSLAAVLERRCLEARMKSADSLPLNGWIAAPLADIHAFLQGAVDCRRIADLSLPLTAIDWRQVEQEFSHPPAPPALSRTYTALKLLFLPWAFRRHSGAEEAPIGPEPSILPLLRGGRARDAYRVAHRRLRSSGFTPLLPEVNVVGDQESRLAAALLIPIRYQDMYHLADLALMPVPEAA